MHDLFFMIIIKPNEFIFISLVPPPPNNVVVVRFDSTSIGVSWTKLTLVELKGLANYIVTYNIIIGSRKRQLGGTMTVPWTENRVIISGLQPGAEYDITVSTVTAAGMSGILTSRIEGNIGKVCYYLASWLKSPILNLLM